MSKIDPKVKEILSKYHDNPEEAVWFHKQSGQWLAKHKALEAIAVRAGIKFDAPVMLQFDLEKKIAALVVYGEMGDKKEWSIGEATAYNSQNQYYGAMAEKRGKDRVILKLIGLHGDVYSDEEIEGKPSGAIEGGVLDDEARNDAKIAFLKEVHKRLDDAQDSVQLENALTKEQKEYIKSKLQRVDKDAYDYINKRYRDLKATFKKIDEEALLEQFNRA